MIKKMIIISLAVSMLTHANGIESEIGINIGLDSTKNDDGSKFENPTMGMTYQNNSYVIKPRFDLEYVKIKNDQASAFLKGSANAVYEYENKTYVVPYVLAGVGYEYVSDPTSNALESHAFIQGGAGLKVDLDDGYKVGIEGKYLEVIGSKNNEGNEIIVTVGLTIPICTTEKKVIHKPIIRATPKPLHVIPIPIVNTKPKIVYIDENTCSIKISQPDLDRDGISDVRDQCPSTPCDFKVDYDGCPVKATLKINFATNSARIQEYSMHKVDDFTNFLLTNKARDVLLTGFLSDQPALLCHKLPRVTLYLLG